jgi:hypothetical protein
MSDVHGSRAAEAGCCALLLLLLLAGMVLGVGLSMLVVWWIAY